MTRITPNIAIPTASFLQMISSRRNFSRGLKGPIQFPLIQKINLMPLERRLIQHVDTVECSGSALVL